MPNASPVAVFPPVFLSPVRKTQHCTNAQRASSYLDQTQSLQSLQFVGLVSADTAAHTLCSPEPMLTLLAQSIMFSFLTGRDRCSFINACMTQLPRPSAAELGQRQASRLISLCLLWLTVPASQQEGNYICCHPAKSGRKCRGNIYF